MATPVKVVDAALTTDAAGNVVEAVPVRAAWFDDTNEVGKPVTPLDAVEDEAGTRVRMVDEKIVLNSAGKPVSVMPIFGIETAVGGIDIGTAGEVGTIYEGYTLAVGDDFTTLNILAPHRPRGKYWPTRTYFAGARGSDTALNTMFDTDPYFTGHEDSNRGVPVGYDNMLISASALRLVARNATAGEQAHMQSLRNEVAAMISGIGAFHWYPGAADTDDVIIEARIKIDPDAPAGDHFTFWLLSLNPSLTFESDEFDHESNSGGAYFNKHVWTAGESTSTTSGTAVVPDGNFHTISFKSNTTNIRRYIDGVLNGTLSNGNQKSKPQYGLLSHHIVNGTYQGEAYSAAEWDADPDGSYVEVDWWRVWTRTGKAHYKPLVNILDHSVDYGASLTFTLPSKAALWGDDTVSEYLQVVYHEENEPGVTHTTVFDQFPSGVSYNSGTREVTVNITSGKTGRLNFVLSAWKTGCSGVPARFAVNVGPVAALPASLGSDGEVMSIDLYALQDCGVLTSDGSARAKTVEIDGLAGSGLSYNDATGLITGTAVAGIYDLTVTVTNSLGQTDSISGEIEIAELSIADWAAAVEWWDASDGATVFSDAAATTPAVAGSTVAAAIVGKKLGAVLANTIAGQTPEYVNDGLSGLKAIDFVRANNDYLFTQDATVVAEVSGNDNPFAMVGAFRRGAPDVSATPFSFSPDTGTILDYIRAFFGSSDSVGMIRAKNGTLTTAQSANDQVTADQWYVVSWVFNGVDVWIRLNGTLIADEVFLDVASMTINRLSLGGRYDDTTNVYNSAVAFDGAFGEMILLDGTVADDDSTLALAEQYLMAKWT